MDAILHFLLIETTIPVGVRFNENNVAMNGLRHEFNFHRLHVKFDLCFVNGLWGGEYDVMTNTWGCGGPITREDFKLHSFEECADYLWGSVFERVSRNKEGITKEFLHFKVTYKRLLTLTVEQKYNLFKEAEFYDTL